MSVQPKVHKCMGSFAARNDKNSRNIKLFLCLSATHSGSQFKAGLVLTVG